MTRRTALLLLLGLSGLALYLWPVVSAPVVLWSDSEMDIAWARMGVGIVSPVPTVAQGEVPAHPAKPAYLLFLRTVLAAAPSGHETRAIVVVQSLLLWLSIAGTSMFIGRRRGAVTGVAIYLLLISFLRLRDSASAVMPEALATALLLPLAASLLDPPGKPVVSAALGFATALLFWVRPNVGGAALVLAMAAVAARRRWPAIGALLVGFLLPVAPIWILTGPRGEGPALRGFAHSILEGSTDYYWVPTVPRGRPRPPSEAERHEIAQAGESWKKTITRGGSDARRQLVWRTFHGLLGTEFYDARWSPVYRTLTTASRLATPVVLLAAVAVLFVGLFRNREGLLGSGTVLIVFGQDLLLGSNPRFFLPFLPVLCLFAVSSGASISRAKRGSRAAIAIVFAFLVASAARNPHVLDWEWGRIESARVAIRQRIPRGSLPKTEPATLHVRIAPPMLPSAAHLELRGPENRLLYTSVNDSSREKPLITVPLPEWLLQRNASEAVDLQILAIGSYGDSQSLLFPVVPWPWRAPSRREGSAILSPSTGIVAGSLDCWAHAGED